MRLPIKPVPMNPRVFTWVSFFAPLPSRFDCHGRR